MRLKSQVQQLQKDRTGLEHRCKSWEEEARRVQAELDAHLASARHTQTARGSVNTDQARITQQVGALCPSLTASRQASRDSHEALCP